MVDTIATIAGHRLIVAIMGAEGITEVRNVIISNLVLK